MPKSSSSRWTPAARMWRSLAAMPVFSSSRMTDSTISSESFSGGRPAALQRLEQELRRNRGSRNSVPETLIASRPKEMPAWCHSAASAIAFSTMMRPICAISPDFSATGMNSPGEIMPRCGMVPAHQCLDAGDGAVGQRHLRLEIDAEVRSAMAILRSRSSCLRCSSSCRSSSEKNEKPPPPSFLAE